MNRRQWLQRVSIAAGSAAVAFRVTASPLVRARGRVLLVSTSVAQKPDGRPTGLWMSELTTPYWLFSDAGLQVAMASRGGGASVSRFEHSGAAQQAFRSMPALAALGAEIFDAVFFCGGHGTMWDFGTAAVRQAVERHAHAGAVVAALCHGPAALIDARSADGRPLVAGRRITGFTEREEDAVELTAAVPFLLETELRRLGARFENAANFRAHAVRDGNLVTGQNPASAEGTAQFVLEALAARG
jgi:putative intracellular protease/amidase